MIMADMGGIINILGLSNLIGKFLGKKLEETNNNTYYRRDLLGEFSYD